MGIPLHIRDIDLEGLTPGQKEMTLKLLTEEADSFAKDDNDVGCIPDLKLDLDLEDQTPVQKNYVAVPRDEGLHWRFVKPEFYQEIIILVQRTEKKISKHTAVRGF